MNEALVQVTVRLMVGLICAAIGAFFGALVIAMMFTAADAESFAANTARFAFVAVTAAAGSRIGWYGTSESVQQSVALYVSAVFAGMVGTWLALTIASLVFDHSDVYLRFFAISFVHRMPLASASRAARLRGSLARNIVGGNHDRNEKD